jgi:hypothetical protein
MVRSYLNDKKVNDITTEDFTNCFLALRSSEKFTLRMTPFSVTLLPFTSVSSLLVPVHHSRNFPGPQSGPSHCYFTT